MVSVENTMHGHRSDHPAAHTVRTMVHISSPTANLNSEMLLTLYGISPNTPTTSYI